MESCDIEMPDAPEAAEAELDFVRLKLTFFHDEDLNAAGHGVGELADPTASTVDWAAYVERESHTPLRGELACEAVWAAGDGYVTDSDLGECDLGGAIDGQLFTYEFAAVHRDVVLSASVDYVTASVSDQAEGKAEDHAVDLFGTFAAVVADAMPSG